MKKPLQYLVNHKGKVTDVVINIDDFKDMIEELENTAMAKAIEKTKDDVTGSF